LQGNHTSEAERSYWYAKGQSFLRSVHIGKDCSCQYQNYNYRTLHLGRERPLRAGAALCFDNCGIYVHRTQHPPLGETCWLSAPIEAQ
jgi:hypothetical protein